MKTLIAALLLVAASFGVMAETRDPGQHFFQPLLGDLRAEAGDLISKGKKGFVLVFEMDECPFCDRMHANILSDSKVQKVYRDKFGVFRIDIRSTNPVVDIGGHETTEKKMAEVFKIRGTPTTVFVDFEGRELARFVGPAKDVNEFLLLANYVSNGDYRTHPFARYRKEQK
jgi:thioredoxin-related protein